MPVTAPADRRFRRAHMKPARKRARTCVAALARGRRRRSSSGLALYAGHRAVAVVAGLEMFHVDRINVRGNQRLSNGEVLALLQGLRGRSILAVDLAEWRRALLNSPWVADASLRRTLPSTVDVVILERAPLGIGRINGVAVSRRRSRRGHRRVRTELRRSRSADHRRPVVGDPGEETTGRVSRDARAAAARCAARAEHGGPDFADRRERCAQRRRAAAKAIRRSSGSATSGSSSGCSRISSWRRRCASACRRSITSISDSTSGSM